jgi:hypothetical protein
MARLEDTRSTIDPIRAMRTIRILGTANLLLIIALGISIWWASPGSDALRIHAPATFEDQPVKVFMEARMTSEGGEPIRSGETVTSPILAVHGVLVDYGRLREGLDGLAVTVRGTRVDISPETGEFTERVVLSPGLNRLEFGVWWNGREWQKNHADVIYAKQENSEPATSL